MKKKNYEKDKVNNKLLVLIKADFEWISYEKRMNLYGELSNWAKDEYDFEKKYFESTIEDLLKRYKYGLSIEKQIEIEKNFEFHISNDERREIIVTKEKPIRTKTEKVFTEIVQSKVGNKTIIPETIDYLFEENNKLYFLTEEKNNISFPVKTAQEIIYKESNPFEVVFNDFVERLKTSSEINPLLVKHLNFLNPQVFQKMMFKKNYKNFIMKQKSKPQNYTLNLRK